MNIKQDLFWYELDDIENDDNKASIVAKCFLMWGNCYLAHPPSYFGEWMVVAGKKLGFTAIEKNLDQYAKENGLLTS